MVEREAPAVEEQPAKEAPEEPRSTTTTEVVETTDLPDSLDEMGEAEQQFQDGAQNAEPEADNAIYGKIEDFLQVFLTKIDLGSTLPGQVKEEDLQIAYKDVGKLGRQLKVEVKVTCESQRFDDLDEYVFGLRKPPNYDFNDTFIIKMDPLNKITLRCAVKIPNVKEEMVINGNIKMECHNLEGKIVIPVTSQVQ